MPRQRQIPRVGTRVYFNPNPASLMLYSPGHPRRGESGVVSSMHIPGVGRIRYLPGPGGGMLYVQWEDTGMYGVSPRDVSKTPPALEGLCECDGIKTKWSIVTDAVATTVIAADEDEAASRFASSEGIVGINTAKKLIAWHEKMGGWCEITPA